MNMAFCAKCGTVLDASGVCPVCGYVLNRDKYPLPEDQGGNQPLENTVQLSDLSETVNSSVDFVPAVEPAADCPI